MIRQIKLVAVILLTRVVFQLNHKNKHLKYNLESNNLVISGAKHEEVLPETSSIN